MTSARLFSCQRTIVKKACVPAQAEAEYSAYRALVKTFLPKKVLSKPTIHYCLRPIEAAAAQGSDTGNSSVSDAATLGISAC